jgi:hypothetical protein
MGRLDYKHHLEC